MKQFSALRPVVRSYVGAVVLAGLIVLSISVRSIFASTIGTEWLLLAGLTVLTGSFSVKVPSINAYISVSEAFVFASVLLFGAGPGTITVLLECLVILLWMKPQGRPAYRLLFNLAAPSVAIWCSGQAFYFLSGIRPYSQIFTPLPQLFVPLLAFTAAYFILNSFLVAVAVGLETKRSPLQIWWNNFAWLSVNYFSGASLAALIVTYTQRLEVSTLAVIIPLLVVSYLTFRTAMARAEDSYNHLAELNRLYLSTIETLAMAIDAKDQVTHGHIRRVQAYAVGLATNVGVTDTVLLKAIEAAALLHDMGKLAIPEYILNKPGKLTAPEFETMKLHAGVGAEILSAIDFPYPVVPIVRHHHENWDGTGYPDGLAGTDIPIGARILSVVDCFDALTSDRPYRSRLSDAEAIAILNERRGSMYDPLVVDTFVRVHEQIAPQSSDEQAYGRSEIFGFSRLKPALASVASPASGGHSPIAPDGLAEPLSRAVCLLEDMQRKARFKVGLWLKKDPLSNELKVIASVGLQEADVNRLSFHLGRGLTGWVAANGRSICNSDAALDLGEVARDLALTHAASIELDTATEGRGVLSVYRDSPFSDAEIRVMRTFGDSSLGSVRKDDQPNREAIAESRELTPVPQVAGIASVLCIRVENYPDVAKLLGLDVYRHSLSRLADRLRPYLSSGDLLVHGRDDELAVLLSRRDAQDVRALLRQLRRTADEVNREWTTGGQLDLTFDAILTPLNPAELWTMLSPPPAHEDVSKRNNRVH